MPLQFRIADERDVDAIKNLINRAFDVDRFFVDGDRVDDAMVASNLASGEFLLAEDEQGLAASVYLEPRGEAAYLGLLSVDPSRQKSGLGSRLLDAAERRCRNRGRRRIDLYVVNVREELPVFYRNRGYVEAGTAPFPAVETKLPCHLIQMTKALDD